jgi:hypothetical protein
MAKSSRRAEPAIPVSEEPVAITIKAPADADGEGSDVQPDVAEAAFNALREMEGEMGAALHAVHMRLVEMLPFLDSAVAQADGELKQFLADLMADLTS